MSAARKKTNAQKRRTEKRARLRQRAADEKVALQLAAEEPRGPRLGEGGRAPPRKVCGEEQKQRMEQWLRELEQLEADEALAHRLAADDIQARKREEEESLEVARRLGAGGRELLPLWPAPIDVALLLSQERGARLDVKGGGGAPEPLGREAEAEDEDAKLARELASACLREEDGDAKLARELSSAYLREGEADAELARELAETFRREAQEERRKAEESNRQAALALLGVKQCPHCSAPWSVLEVNCGIFVCGVTCHGQLPQHDEAAAARERGRGAILAGCGLQFRLEGERLVCCTGQ
jgi:hypothetical protein